MPENRFNAYTQWLGIPPQEQPPTHYRLLGIKPLEADAAAIDAAARKVAELIKSKAVEPYVGAAKKLLIEVAAARTCLLDSDTKTEYDQSLQDRPVAAAQAAAPAAPLRPIPIRPAAKPGPAPPRRPVGAAPVASVAPTPLPAKPAPRPGPTPKAPDSDTPEAELPFDTLA